MPEYFRPLLKDLECYRNGPLTPHMDDFAALLVERHYSNPTGWRKLRLVSDLSQWLAKRRLKITELDEQAIKAFLQARWRKRRHQSGERSTLALLVHQLRAKTFIPAPEPPPIRSWQDLIIQDYEQFLLRERGLMPASADHYLRTVRRFLSERFPTGKGHLKQLRPQDITDFVLHASSCRGRQRREIPGHARLSGRNDVHEWLGRSASGDAE